jgi:hypothetical protein
MDYAFDPGVTPFERTLARLLKARDNTQLVTQTGVANVADFFKSLQTQNLKGGNLIVGSHAVDEGIMEIALDGSTGPKTDYEGLEGVNSRGSIKLNAAISDANTSLHFKGCAIGADESLPYLRLLKQALGTVKQVTAPRFVYGLNGDLPDGVFEYMLYEFRVMSVQPLADYAAVTNAFQTAATATPARFSLLNGSPVPAANWSKWVQQVKRAKPTPNLSPANKDEVRFPVALKIAQPDGTFSDVEGKGNFWAEADRWTFPITFSNVASMPPKAQWPGLLKPAMQGATRYTSAHPYPIYVRKHFPDFDSFFAGFTWTPQPDTTSTPPKIVYTGVHYVYTLLIPVTVAGTDDQLIYNFYPTSGPPLMHFKEDNAAYPMFAIV